MSVAPNLPYIGDGDTGLSNFDFSVDPGIEEALRVGDVKTRYAGWNFNGQVWYDTATEEFVCEVWQYLHPVEVVRSDSLQELMHDVSDRYGYE